MAAKNVFQVHGIDAAEKVVVRKQLRRSQVLAFFNFLSFGSLIRTFGSGSNCAKPGFERTLGPIAKRNAHSGP